MKRKLFFLAICIFSLALPSHNLHAQEITDNPDISETNNEQTSILGSPFQPAKSFSEFIHSLDFIFQMEGGPYINPDTKNSEGKIVSAPSPVIYPLTIGLIWPNTTFISVQPTLSFSMMTHLWYDGKALPAEIENRTSTTLSFMINIPAVISLYFGKSRLQLMPGAAVNIRYAMLANNVSADDSGYSGTAGQDIENINSWFWADGRFFYLTSAISWLYNPYANVKIGPVISMYLPIIPLMMGQGFQGTIISLGLKISL